MKNRLLSAAVWSAGVLALIGGAAVVGRTKRAAHSCEKRQHIRSLHRAARSEPGAQRLALE